MQAPIAAAVFLIITGLVVVSLFTVMAWRKNRKSKLFAVFARNCNSSNKISDAEDWSSSFSQDAGAERGTKRHSRNWRWKRILQHVGWIRVRSSVEDDDDDDDDRQEMPELHRRCALVDSDKTEKGTPIWESAATCHAFVSRDATIRDKVTGPSHVPPFENLGGYRYGDYSYGPDNMAPLPVPAPARSSATYLRDNYHSEDIAEVEALSRASCSDIPSLGPQSNKPSMESSFRLPLTSYNGFWASGQDDVMDALPIPKDHPLCQHDPGDASSSVCHLPRPTGERNLAAVRYDQESLIPAPLDPRRSKHSRVVSCSMGGAQDQPSALEMARQPSASSGRPRARAVSAFDFPSRAKFGSRYSHFENPLRQHPIQVGNCDAESKGSPKQTESHRSVELPAEAKTFTFEIPFTFSVPMVPDRTRKRYSLDLPTLEARSHTTVAPDEVLRPRSLHIGGQTTKTLKHETRPPLFETDKELAVIVENPGPIQVRRPSLVINARPVTAPPRSPVYNVGHPPALQIGRHRSTRSAQVHRQYSICDGVLTSVPLVPIRPPPGKPSRKRLAAEEHVAGAKRSYEE